MAGRQGTGGTTLMYGVVAPISSWSIILRVQSTSSPMEVPIRNLVLLRISIM